MFLNVNVSVILLFCKITDSRYGLTPNIPNTFNFDIVRLCDVFDSSSFRRFYRNYIVR